MSGLTETLYSVKNKDSSETYDRSTDSLEAISEVLATIPTVTATRHDIKYTGDIWYVSKSGNDANDGYTPTTAFLTLGFAISAAAAGDRIVMKAGSYDEAGVDMNLAGLELHCEAGVFLVDTTPGTCLVVSADACVVLDAHFVQAGGVGLQITGKGAIVRNCIAVACTIGFDINQHSTQMFDCISGAHTVTGFDIAAQNTIMRNCHAAGSGATRGFYISNAAVIRSLFDQCTSAGNTTAGFEVITAAIGNVFQYCTSGAGDGIKLDPSHGNIWANYSYDSELAKELTFAGAPTTYNLFTVTGTVLIRRIYGIVTNTLPNTASAMHLDVYSITSSTPLTKIAGAPDVDSLIQGSLLVKVDTAGTILSMSSADAPVVVESAASSTDAGIIVVADLAEATYIRCNITVALASGDIDWHVHWEPISDDGKVVAS